VNRTKYARIRSSFMIHELVTKLNNGQGMNLDEFEVRLVGTAPALTHDRHLLAQRFPVMFGGLCILHFHSAPLFPILGDF